MKPINRLEKIKEIKNLKNSDLDNIFELSAGATAKALKKKASLKDENIIKLLEFFPDINCEWFMLGEGPIFKNVENQVFKDVKKEESNNTIDILKNQIKDLKNDKRFLQDQLTICMSNLSDNKKNSSESA